MARALFWLAVALAAVFVIGSAVIDLTTSGPCADQPCLDPR